MWARRTPGMSVSGFHSQPAAVSRSCRRASKPATTRRRVRLERWPHAVFDPEVDADRPGDEPHPAARPHRLGLGDLGEPEQLAVERARRRLAARRNRELHVIDADDAHHRRRHQRPFHTGARLPRNAAMPSAASSSASTRPSSLAESAAARLPPDLGRDRTRAGRARSRPGCARRARPRAASSRPRARRPATTRLTSPHARASAASSLRPVSIISSVFLRPTERVSSAVIIIGHRPTAISVVPNTALSAAITSSHATIRPRPPASAGPLTIAMIGLPSACIASIRSTRLAGAIAGASAPLACCIAARSPPAENTGPAPVKMTTSHRGARTDRGERGDELPARRGADRIALVGAVQRQARDRACVVDEDRAIVRHARHIARWRAFPAAALTSAAGEGHAAAMRREDRRRAGRPGLRVRAPRRRRRQRPRTRAPHHAHDERRRHDDDHSRQPRVPRARVAARRRARARSAHARRHDRLLGVPNSPVDASQTTIDSRAAYWRKCSKAARIRPASGSAANGGQSSMRTVGMFVRKGHCGSRCRRSRSAPAPCTSSTPRTGPASSTRRSASTRAITICRCRACRCAARCRA